MSRVTAPAEARPMFERRNKWSMMNLAGTSLAVPGPPPVIATTASYSFTTAVHSSRNTVAIVGPSIGSTICR
jgi:hypothetical protein